MRLPILFAALALAGCSTKSGTATPADSGAGSGSDASAADSGAALYLPAGYTLTPFVTDSATTHTYKQADQALDTTKDYVVVLETTSGRIVWQLSTSNAPVASNSFIFLTLHHYFDGIAFHRVLDRFVAQGGDPNTLTKPQSTWGTGGPGYAFDNENTDGGLNFDDSAGGIVAMANTGAPKSNGSQFFITFGAQSSLDGGYTIFGKVLEGMDVLPQIIRGEPPHDASTDGYPTRITEAHIGEKPL
ncbi:MAG: peptidylprolyl isomerase [Polyangiaceae bacterium]